MSVYHLQNGVYFLKNGVYSLTPAGDGQLTIDDFEDGSLTEYEQDVGQYSVVQNSAEAYAGDFYLRGQTGGTIYSTDGLPNYFARGQSARAYVYCESSATERAWVLFGAVDNRDHYIGRVDWVNGAFALARRTSDGGGSGLQTLTEDTAVEPPAGTWLRVDIDWGSDDTIALSLVDPSDESELSAVSATDSTHADATGVGMTVDGQGANGVRFDQYVRGSVSGGGGGGSGGTEGHGLVSSFESDLSAFSGATGAFEIADAAALGFSAKDGSSVLRATAQGEIYSQPGDGLSRYPRKGQRGHIWIRWGDNPTFEHRFNLGRADDSNNYLFRVRPSAPELEIGSENNGNYTVIDSAPLSGSLIEGAWYRIPWMWDDGRWEADNRLSASLETGGGTTLASVAGINADHANQRGVAIRNWNGASGDTLVWDDFRITGGAE